MTNPGNDRCGSRLANSVPVSDAGSPLFVVIPTYNERENIVSLVPAILSLGPEYHVLVVDDQSPDYTGTAVAELARKDGRVHLLERSGRGGYGSAVTDGFKLALECGARRIFTMDADFSHNPKDLALLDRTLERADIAIGSRYLGGIRILNWSLGRLLLSVGANGYIRFLLRLPYTDCTSGFRGYRRRAVEHLASFRFNSRGYAFLVEILHAAAGAGFTVAEAPIVYTERRAGQSKMSKATIGEAALRPWLLLLRGFRRRIGTPARQD